MVCTHSLLLLYHLVQPVVEVLVIVDLLLHLTEVCSITAFRKLPSRPSILTLAVMDGLIHAVFVQCGTKVLATCFTHC